MERTATWERSDVGSAIDIRLDHLELSPLRMLREMELACDRYGNVPPRTSEL